ncbi:hypothetical protein [Nocardiopsis aegyptia]|uniref:Uncharacterized protein n=1 Tax=Nocardiopsis aegyptia TaxID=220378 RepID=A0A7Z0EPM7_9ACTN|nr:hypothetical protein [Nocardiopsis aegyptia]NYJ35962.1 hypothetical protein [Nocardiopsis aegyptia]
MRLRPVFDPMLPQDLVRHLRKHPEDLTPVEPGTPAGRRRPRRGRALVGALALVGSLALVVAVEAWFGRWWALGTGFASLFCYVPPRGDVKRVATPLVLGACTIFPWWIWALALSGTWAWLPFAFLHPVLFGLFVNWAPAREFHVPRDRYVLPEELAHPEQDRLERVRSVIGTVQEAERLLSSGFGGTDALLVLREEEWRLAESMRRIAPLAAEIDTLASNAVSDRVRRAMRPQVAVLAEARGAHRAAVERVEAYVRPVEEAVAAHREWEQYRRLAAGGDGYADVLAETRGRDHGALAGAPGLTADPALETARRELSRRTGRAAEANTWLLRAVRGQR